MSRWDCEQFRCAIGGRWHIEPIGDEIAFAGVSIDTRSIEKDQVFFAFVGKQVDGHAYLEQAKLAGASVCVVSDVDRVPEGFGAAVIVVDDMLGAITDLALAWREGMRALVIGITGSNGKTTTCRLMHALCAQSGLSVVSQKSYNNALGVPITILNTPMDADYLVAEIGTSSVGEISARSKLLELDVAMITSIGHAHLEELGDLAGVAKEKMAIVDGLKPDGFLVVPVGIAELENELANAEHDGVEIVRVDPAVAMDVETVGGRTRFEFDGQAYELAMIGAHNVSNAMLAISAAKKIGIDTESICDGLTMAEPVAMRFERVDVELADGGSMVFYNDAYNANLDSMRAALAAFDSLETAGTKVAVIGQMLELGEQSEVLHRMLIDELGSYGGIDGFVLVGEAYGRFAKGISDENMIVIPAKDAGAIEEVVEYLAVGATVLLKGSRGVGLERVIGLIQNEAKNSGQVEAP